MALNEKILYKNLKEKFQAKEDFLEELEKELENVLNEVREVSENSAQKAKLMNSYLYSYPYMIQSCKKFSGKLEQEGKGKFSDSGAGVHDLVEAMFMIYSWMPRSLQFNSGKRPDTAKLIDALEFLPKLQQERAAGVWREVKRDVYGVTNLDGVEGERTGNLKNIKEMLEGSMVALSKFLHFVNPKLFPMYDLNVARVLHRRVYTVEDYIIYSQCFERVSREFYSDEEGFVDDVRWREDLSKKVSEKAEKFDREFGCELTPIRAMELILFRKGREPVAEENEGEE